MKPFDYYVLTISVMVAIGYYNVENKKQEDQSQQQQIQQLQQKLNEKPTVVVEQPVIPASVPTVLPPSNTTAPPVVPPTAVPTVPTLPNGDLK